MYLNYISDKDLETHIKATLDYYRETLEKIDLAKFNSNIVDPIKLTFDSIVYNKEIGTIISEEIARQRDKTNTNAIGYFHQGFFEFLKGCTVPSHGFDIIYDDGKKKTYVELKNKHNTMNSSSSQKTFTRMLAQVSSDNNCECYLVEVIAKKSQNIDWAISLDGEHISNPRIKRVSIDKFYEIITGDKNAFMKLCKALPTVISKIVNETLAKEREEDTVFEELKQKNSNMLKALYLSAFKTYEGFDSF